MLRRRGPVPKNSGARLQQAGTTGVGPELLQRISTVLRVFLAIFAISFSGCGQTSHDSRNGSGGGAAATGGTGTGAVGGVGGNGGSAGYAGLGGVAGAQ